MDYCAHYDKLIMSTLQIRAEFEPFEYGCSVTPASGNIVDILNRYCVDISMSTDVWQMLLLSVDVLIHLVSCDEKLVLRIYRS